MGCMAKFEWNLKKASLRRRKRARRRKKPSNGGWEWCVDVIRRKRSLWFRKKKFMDR